jgi:very-short-patch-repair endonuclease
MRDKPPLDLISGERPDTSTKKPLERIQVTIDMPGAKDPEQPLRQLILEALQESSGLKSTELATALGRDRREVNRCLGHELAGQVQQGSDYRWRLVQRASQQSASAERPTTEIARICRYYLECISHDMDEGASVSARSQDGDPTYAQLASVPIGTQGAWWNSAGVARLVGKVRDERGKLTLWLGYPVRLRRHRTPPREGYQVEPVLMWSIQLPDANGDAPTIDEQMPVLNGKFLRTVAMGDGMQLAGEAARLVDELGLGVPASELPEVSELVERLVRIRPDWDWQEELDLSACSTAPLSEVTKAGIYNCAVIIPGERSPYTQGLETELKGLADVTEEKLQGTALGWWLTPSPATGSPDTPELGPLLEVLPMNTEQRAAVRAALTAKHTIVTGPPGTGKSQVVTNMLVNAAFRGMKVLFASKNNKAVDVVEARVNGLGNRPVLLRLGAKGYQEKLSGYLTQLLAGNPGEEVRLNYSEALERHRGLAARLADLDQAQQRTLECRNTVDRLDADADAGRGVFGPEFTSMNAALNARAYADFLALRKAVDRVDRDKQGLVTRLFWSSFRTARFRQLADKIHDAASTLNALRLNWQGWQESDGIAELRAKLSELSDRVHLVHKVVKYREALEGLQKSPSFESIAVQRTALMEEVSQNSARLWRDWVQLAPTRLTAAERKDVADYAAALQLTTGPDVDRVHPSVKRRARALQAKVTSLFSCWGITSLSARGRIPMEPGYFDLVVIDEASQCDIASALPLLYRAKRSVIIGDPMQLRHISALTRPRDSELQHKHGLVESRLGWMYSVNSLFDVAASIVPSENLINLRDHHRSHADIIGFSNEAFYEGKLRVATRYPQLNRPRAKEPGIVWQDAKGTVIRPRDGGAQNAEEARAVVDALVDLLVRCGYTGSVGVVTPFRAQAQLLQSLVQTRRELDGVAAGAELLVDTVHKFQGDERDVMFFSPVVSKGISPGALGFLRSNGNLFNVAITRARGLLHVVGDRGTAAACGVDYLEKFAAYVGTLDTNQVSEAPPVAVAAGSEYPSVAHPERVSDWERVLYRAMVAAGLRPIPQYSVEQYDLDFAVLAGDRKLAVEVDGERYHRSWTGELCLRDQLRNQRLIELGWDVQRFWVYEIRDELQGCVKRIEDWAAGVGTAAR